MAEILIKIKIEGNRNALAFVERTQPYPSKTPNPFPPTSVKWHLMGPSAPEVFRGDF